MDPISLQKNVLFEAMSKKNHVEGEFWVILELFEEDHLPATWVSSRQRREWLGKVREPFDREVGDPNYFQRGLSFLVQFPRLGDGDSVNILFLSG